MGINSKSQKQESTVQYMYCTMPIHESENYNIDIKTMYPGGGADLYRDSSREHVLYCMSGRIDIVMNTNAKSKKTCTLLPGFYVHIPAGTSFKFVALEISKCLEFAIKSVISTPKLAKANKKLKSKN